MVVVVGEEGKILTFSLADKSKIFLDLLPSGGGLAQSKISLSDKSDFSLKAYPTFTFSMLCELISN